MKTVIDYTTCCDDCLCSYLRIHTPEQRFTHPKPFYCLHPKFEHENKKVTQEDKPFSQRPDWCPLAEESVLITVKPKD
jgi:hypothetical protein